MTSARKPGTRRPRSSSRCTSSALVTVDATIASTGRMPRCTSAQSSFQFCPCGIAGASVPVAIFAPASIRRAIVFLAIGKTSAALACSSGAAFDDVHALGEVRRRHDERAPLERELLRLLAHERRVLDAVDPGLDRGLDPLVTVRVRGDPHAASVRFVDDRPQLLVGVVLRARRTGERHDATRRAHLDLLGAVLDLVAHRPAHLADAVGDPLFDRQRQHPGREPLEHRRVEVPTARRDRVPGREDPRPGDPTGVDRLHERDVEEQSAGLHEQARGCAPS